MRRNVLNYLVDAVTLLAILGLAWTGLVIRYALPPGTGGRHGGAGWALFGGSRHDWGDIHTGLAVTLGVLLLIHLGLHWSWVCRTTRKLLPGGDRAGTPSAWRENAYGAGALILLGLMLGGGTWWAAQVVDRGTAAQRHERRASGIGDYHSSEGTLAESASDEAWIRGRMTLGEVAELSDLTFEELCAKLGMSGEVSPDDRLGRSMKRYGLTMSQVRALAGSSRAGSTLVAP